MPSLLAITPVLHFFLYQDNPGTGLGNSHHKDQIMIVTLDHLSHLVPAKRKKCQI